MKKEKNKGPMSLVALLVVLNHLPLHLVRFMLNGHVAEVKYLIFQGATLFIFICFTARRKPPNDPEH